MNIFLKTQFLTLHFEEYHNHAQPQVEFEFEVKVEVEVEVEVEVQVVEELLSCLERTGTCSEFWLSYA